MMTQPAGDLWVDVIDLCEQLTVDESQQYTILTLYLAGKRRQFAVPSEPLKAVQRRVLNEVLDSAAAHKTATAYCRGSSILQNAKLHHRRAFTFKTDIVNYFGAITASHITQTLLRFFPELSGA